MTTTGTTERAWIDTDPQSIRHDIKRLGVRGAGAYNARLARERVASGDTRWRGITVQSMTAALRELGQEG